MRFLFMYVFSVPYLYPVVLIRRQPLRVQGMEKDIVRSFLHICYKGKWIHSVYYQPLFQREAPFRASFLVFLYTLSFLKKVFSKKKKFAPEENHSFFLSFSVEMGNKNISEQLPSLEVYPLFLIEQSTMPDQKWR